MIAGDLDKRFDELMAYLDKGTDVFTVENEGILIKKQIF